MAVKGGVRHNPVLTLASSSCPLTLSVSPIPVAIRGQPRPLAVLTPIRRRRRPGTPWAKQPVFGHPWLRWPYLLVPCLVGVPSIIDVHKSQ